MLEQQIRTILHGMKTPFLLLLLIMLPNLSHGAMYKWTNSEGEVIYSDTPPSDETEELKLPILTTLPAVKYKAKPKPAPTKEIESKATVYTDFKLVDPVNDAIIRDNSGNVPVILSLKPALDANAGHKINILLDGQTNVSNSQQLSLILENIDRGTHTLSAEIRDHKGVVLKASNSVSFTLYRYSKLQKKAK
ncbi:MAG: DUF4124 domain-containing protein [Gammaproteobacteria bacterium]|nr:DUF4124 domain-containing protein [Gammaproteobacteria bacterium]